MGIRIFVCKIVTPIIKNQKFFISLILLLYLPSLFYWIKNFSPFLQNYGILALPAVFFGAYTLCVVVYLTRERNWIKNIILSIVYVCTIIETFVILFFSTRITPSIIALICETNATEIQGFLSTYVVNKQFAIYVIIVLLFTFFLIRVNNHDYKICQKGGLLDIKKISMSNYLIKVLLSFVVVFSVGLGLFREGRNIIWHKYNIDEIGRIRKYAFYSTCYLSSSCLYDAIRLYRLSLRDVPVLVESLKKTDYDVCKYRSKNIVVIIGESFNKHHSNLYGYPLITNPCLEKEKNLYIMEDVITTDRLTSIVMKNIFSFRNKENGMYWAENTLFPAIFKKAGYFCTLISNQEVSGGNFHDVYNMANDYLVHPSTRQYLWNITNDKTYEYDSQLVEYYKEIVEQDKPYSLTVFHLLGQHIAYKDRYPKEKKYFSVSDYGYRTDLDLRQKEFLSHYDNAIRYGDEVVKSIIDLFRNDDVIVIFFSDHGEEVYDYRDYTGRSHEPIITKEIARNVFEVPFFIWMSDKYIQTHPDVVKRVANSKDRPYIIDDIPHLLLDLAGIECDLYDDKRSLISDEFLSPKRLLHESMQDYDGFN